MSDAGKRAGRITRRTLALGGAALGLAVAAPYLRLSAPRADRAMLEPVAGPARDWQGLAQLWAERPTADEAALKLGARLPMLRKEVQVSRETLDAAMAADSAAGRLVAIGGWRLPETQALIAAAMMP